MLREYSDGRSRAIDHLEDALADIEDRNARYHVREAMQIIQDLE